MNKCQVQQCQYRTTMQYTLYVQRCYYWLLLLENINKSIELEKTPGTQCNYDATKQSTRIGGVANGAMSAAFRVAFNDMGMLNARSQGCSSCASDVPSPFDKQGGEIFNHWLEGFGDDFIRSGGEWGKYMSADEWLDTAISLNVLSDYKQRTTSGPVFLQFDAETSQSNYTTGYGMLNGTNRYVGGFALNGWANVGANGSVNYNLTATFNDIIDPNPIYLKDRVYSGVLNAVASPKNYTIRLSWQVEKNYARRNN